MIKELLIYERNYSKNPIVDLASDDDDGASLSIENNMLKVVPTTRWTGVVINYPIVDGVQTKLEDNVNYTIEFSLDMGTTDSTDIINVTCTSEIENNNLVSYGTNDTQLINIIPTTPQITSSGVFRLPYTGKGFRWIKFYKRGIEGTPDVSNGHFFYIKYLKIYKDITIDDFRIIGSYNYQIILQNLSCCIGEKTKELVNLKLIGNLKCYKKELKKLIYLEHVYNIIYNYDFNSTNNCLSLDKLNLLYNRAMKNCNYCNC